jgi:hypothetical protein
MGDEPFLRTTGLISSKLAEAVILLPYVQELVDLNLSGGTSHSD